MRKFDFLYDNLLYKLNEKEYIDPTFEDNVRLLIKTLQVNDFLPKDKSTKDILADTMGQDTEIKEIVLDTEDKGMPPIKIEVSRNAGSPNSESFSVAVIPVNEPKSKKEFSNTMQETVFEEVVAYVKQIALKGLEPEKAVDQLPPEQGANAQPGAGASALPQGGAPAEATPPQGQVPPEQPAGV